MSETRRRDASEVGTRPAKEARFDGLASVAKAPGSGRRGEILKLFAQGERSVEQMAETTDQSVANTFHHLQVLAPAGLVSSRRDSPHVRHRPASDRVVDRWAALPDMATSQAAGLDRLAHAYVGDRDELETVDRDDLTPHLNDADTKVPHVRPQPEYEADHIPAARSAPEEELDAVLAETPDDVEGSAYCRRPYCVNADEAARRLTNAGDRARRLADGYPE